MHHVYRQVNALRQCRSVVITQKKENDFPFEPTHLVPRSPLRFAVRAVTRFFNAPWQISGGEVNQILGCLRTERADVLHIFFGSVAVHLLPLLRKIEIPVAISFHGADVAGEMRSSGHALAVGEIFARASVVTARSQALADEVVRMGCPPRKVALQRTLLPELNGFVRKMPENGRWRVVQVARLVAKKGISTALRAFALFRKQFPEATFVVVGEGPMRRELLDLANDLGLSESVEFPGFLPQDAVRQRLEAAHIYLHPSETVGGSDQEGVPNAMLEAMASGLPVVSTNHGGIPEAVRDGSDGWLVSEGDINALAKALITLATDPEGFQRMSASAREHAMDLYGPQAAGRMEGVYLKLLGDHGSA